MKSTKKDVIFSIITGLTTGVIFWRIMVFLDVHQIYGIPVWLFALIVPILWIIGVEFGYFLGRWISFFNQFGRFVAVGFTNTAVDFGVLNTEIYLTGYASGIHYSIFKAISFMVTVIHSYIWNKYWVFEAGQSQGGQSELLKFLSVNIVAILFNVGIASLVVNLIPPFGGMDPKAWANIGAMVGSASALILTFTGARLVVFKKN